MSGYVDLVKAVHDRTYQDLFGDPAASIGLVAESIERLPELLAAGELDAPAVARFAQLLEAPGPPPAGVRYLVSEVNLAAARLLGDADLLRSTALARSTVCVQYAAELEPKAEPSSVRRLADEALELAAEFDLESLDPRLVAEAHLQAGNPDMSSPSPLDNPIPRGLAHFLAAHRIKRARGDGDLPRLEQLMRDAARYLMASLHMPVQDRSEIFERVERACEVFAAVGTADDLRAARLELLRVSLMTHALDVADTTAGVLAADAHLSAEARRDLALSVADLRSKQYRPADALAALDRAAVGEEDPRWRYAETIRANALRIAGDLPAAEAIFTRIAERVAAAAVAAPNELQLRGAHAHVLTHLGMLAVEQGRLAEGEARFADVDEIIGDGFLLDVERLEFLNLAAGSLLRAGATEAAGTRLSAALKLRSRLEQAMDDPFAKERFLNVWSGLDQRQAAVLLRAGDDEQALGVIEDAKSRVLRGTTRIRTAPARAADDGSASLRAAWARADAEVRARRSELEPMGIGDPARAAVAAEVGRLTRHADALRALLERKAAATMETVRPHTDDRTIAEDVAALVDAGEDWAVVSYFGSDEGIGVCVSTDGTVEGEWLDAPTYADLRDNVLEPLGRRREALGEGRGSVAEWQRALDAALRVLHDALIAPVEPILRRHGARRLLMVPHRSLHAVPFGALAGADGVAVIDRYEAVGVVPGVRLAADVLRRERPSGWGRVVALAAPDTAAPLTAIEARSVAETWGDDEGTLIVGAGAHPAALFGAAPDARVLHLACHGAWDTAAPVRSGLRLAPEPEGTPPLFGSTGGLVNPAALMAQLDLSACHVTVLSACDTGLSRVAVSDEPMSLPLVLLLAGSRATVASLWPVRDDSTLLLMGALHAALRDGAAPADALASAQRELRALAPDDAIGRLEQSRAQLPAAGLSDRVRARAEQILTDAVARARGAGDHPYAHPDHWAAFACTGSPAAALQEVPSP